jgi:hypothetical protein
MAEEIGLPPAMWFAERAVNTYLESAGPNYADKMQCLQALRISWSQRTNADDLVLIYLKKIERELRDKAENLRQLRDPPQEP